MKSIIINARGNVLRAAVISNNTLDNLFIDQKNTSSIVGNIYLGRIDRILPGIQAAFIDIGIGKNGFLQLKGNENKNLYHKINKTPVYKEKKKLSEGDFLLVQVTKEEIGTKGVRLDSEISFPGRFLVFIPDGQQKIHTSRKITQTEHSEYLKNNIIPKLKLPKDNDIIIRTAASGVKIKFVNRDLQNLIAQWNSILKKIKKADKITLVHEELDLVRKLLRDWLDEEVQTIYVDTNQFYDSLKIFIKRNFAKPNVKLRKYNLSVDIFDKFGITRQIEKLYQKKVWLKCGGYIIIDKTEALVAIDVNTGKNVKHSNSQETILETNCEAAVEIARQLKLRNLGGIIIVDFIDMRDKVSEKEVVKRLQNALENDKAKSKVYPFTRLGLVQMTRQRMEESWEQHYFKDCVCCSGTGRILDTPIICDQMISQINRFLVNYPGIDVNIKAHSEVINLLSKNMSLEAIEKRYNISIGYLKDDRIHPEQYLIVRKDTGEKIYKN